MTIVQEFVEKIDNLDRKIDRLSSVEIPASGNDAPIDAQYVTMTTNATLTDERVLEAGSGLTLTDGGAGACAVFDVDIGNGLKFTSGSVEARIGNGLGFTSGSIEARIGNGLKFTSGSIEAMIGNGLGFTSGSIVAVTGSGLTLSVSGIALTAPGTLNVSTANTASGNHTHAITTTSDGETNTDTILRSGSNSNLRMGSLSIGTSTSTQKLIVAGSSDDDFEAIRIANTQGSGSFQTSVSLGFHHNTVTHTNPSGKITVKEFDTGDQRASMGFYTRSVNSDSAPAERMTITETGLVGIGTTSPGSNLVVATDTFIGPAATSGNTSDTDITIGLTINQEDNDDGILALKSSDVAHGMTTLAETDTYGLFTKAVATSGGHKVIGLSEDKTGLWLAGYGTNGDTAKTTAARAYIEFVPAKKSGTSIARPASNENFILARDAQTGTTVWIIDRDGDSFYGGTDSGTITDDYDDAHLLTGFRAIMSPKDSPAHLRFKGFLKDTEDILVQQGVLTAPMAEGGLVSDTALKGLLIDAIHQLNEKINKLEVKLNGID